MRTGHNRVHTNTDTYEYTEEFARQRKLVLLYYEYIVVHDRLLRYVWQGNSDTKSLECQREELKAVS